MTWQLNSTLIIVYNTFHEPDANVAGLPAEMLVLLNVNPFLKRLKDADAFASDLIAKVFFARTLLNEGYKVAAKMGERYLNTLDKYEDIVSKNVTENILERHIKPIFPVK